MAEKKKEGEFHIGDGKHLSVRTSTVVEMHDQLRVMTGEAKSLTVDVQIKADFEKIPTEYHMMFMQMMQIRYGNIVNVWDNTQPFAKKEEKKKWYQIWK